MSDGDKGRFSSRLAGGVVGLIFLGWLAFLFVPFPRKEKPAPALKPIAAESKLQSVGLSDNVDWEGLPEFFAVWADTLEWEDNKTWFAYWNPGSNSYSYLFEASRAGGLIRFQAVDSAQLTAQGYMLPETEFPDKAQGSPTHPFVFSFKVPVPVPLPQFPDVHS